MLRLVQQIKLFSGLQDGPSVFSGEGWLRFVCLFLELASNLLGVPWSAFGRGKGTTVDLGQLFLCLTSAKGWKLPVIPVVG